MTALARIALLGAGVVAAAVAVRSPRLVDAVLDRVTALEALPSYRQRTFERLLAAHYAETDQLTPPGATLVVGDSLLMALPGAAFEAGVNQSIGGETMTRLASRLPRIASLTSARAVVLGGGTNDLLAGAPVEAIAEAWQRAVAAIPPGAHLVCVGVPEGADGALDRSQVTAVNGRVAAICRARRGQVVEVTLGRGGFADGTFAPDGVHLSVPARRQLVTAIVEALAGGARR